MPAQSTTVPPAQSSTTRSIQPTDSSVSTGKTIPDDSGLPQEIIFAVAGGVAALSLIAVAAFFAMRRRRQRRLHMTHTNNHADLSSTNAFKDNGLYEMNGTSHMVPSDSSAALQLHNGESTSTLPLTMNRGQSLSISSRANRPHLSSAAATGLSLSEHHQIARAASNEVTQNPTRKR